MSERNLLQASFEFPYHVSIGAVVINSRHEVLCHYFEYLKLKFFEAKDFYLLMRETPESGENYFDTLKRGLMEEFGAKARPIGFLGSLISDFLITGVDEKIEEVQKTTLYFLCEFESLDEALRNSGDVEGKSILKWMAIPDLVKHMQKWQGVNANLDESEVLLRASKYLNNQV
jgi:hypothetical protein